MCQWIGSCKPARCSIGQVNVTDLGRATINRFRWMALKGGVNLKKPEVEYIIYEDCQ